MKVFVTSCVHLKPLIPFLQLPSYNNVFAQKIPLKLWEIETNFFLKWQDGWDDFDGGLIVLISLMFSKGMYRLQICANICSFLFLCVYLFFTYRNCLSILLVFHLIFTINSSTSRWLLFYYLISYFCVQTRELFSYHCN